MLNYYYMKSRLHKWHSITFYFIIIDVSYCWIGCCCWILVLHEQIRHVHRHAIEIWRFRYQFEMAYWHSRQFHIVHFQCSSFVRCNIFSINMINLWMINAFAGNEECQSNQIWYVHFSVILFRHILIDVSGELVKQGSRKSQRCVAYTSNLAGHDKQSLVAKCWQCGQARSGTRGNAKVIELSQSK